MSDMTPRYLPLYKQVKATLIHNIAERRWKPGEAIPNEFRLAEELSVSQGTVRKALDEMASQNLVVRRQGRGTFVAEHGSDRTLFSFFRLTRDDGALALPESEVVDLVRGDADSEECTRLDIPPKSSVVRLRRRRTFSERPLIIERIVVAEHLFPGMATYHELPNSLYPFYEQVYGQTVAKAEERLRAVAGTDQDCQALEILPGSALLEIDRLAITIDNMPVEWRVSRCLTAGCHYYSELF